MILAVSSEKVSSGMKAQLNLHIREVCSGPSLYNNRIIEYYSMYEWRAKAPMILLLMRSMIWICAFCTCEGFFFHLRGPLVFSDVVIHITAHACRLWAQFQSLMVRTPMFVTCAAIQREVKHRVQDFTDPCQIPCRHNSWVEQKDQGR